MGSYKHSFIQTLSSTRFTDDTSALVLAKTSGFSDKQIGNFWGLKESDVRQMRQDLGVTPWVKQVSYLSEQT